MGNKNKSKKVQFHKDVKRRRVRKNLAQRIKRLDKKEISFKTCKDQPFELEPLQQYPMVKVQARTKMLVKRTNYNLIQSLKARVANKVDFLLYGMMYIDQNALKSREEDQSLIRSIFNFYSINYVKITQHSLILKIHKTYQNIYPIQYVVDRLKSEGNQEFYQIAEIIEKINERMANFRETKRASLFDHQIDKYLDRLTGRLSMAMIAPDVIAFSKELLQLSGYSMEYIANSCLLNRSFLFDLFLPQNYTEQIATHMSKFDLSRKYRTGQLSPQQYQLQSSFYNYSSIIDKDNNRIRVKTKRYNLQPGIVFWEVDSIIGKEKLVHYQSLNNRGDKIQYEQLKIQQNYKEIEALVANTQGHAEHSQEKQLLVCKEQQQMIDPIKMQDQ